MVMSGMNQQNLWHDTIEDALRDAISVLGGPKKVAKELWPAKSINDGARYLYHCLESERGEKLSLDEIVWIGSEAKKKGCHVVMAFLCFAWGYKYEPVTREDQADELTRDYIDAVRTIKEIVDKMSALEKPLRGVA